MRVSKEQSLPVLEMDNAHIQSIPGAGKTRVLIAKVKLLLSNGCDKIFLLTFTNAAADEMQNRILVQCGSVDKKVTVSTLHSLMIQHLKSHLPNYRLITPEQHASLLHSVYVEHFDCSAGFEKFETYYNQTRKFKINDDFEMVVLKYFDVLNEHKMYTLDNIIAEGVRFMSQGVLPLFNVKYLMIDEFQDCDIDQVKLIILHAKMGAKITAVGDSDQAIFSFAGSINQSAFDLLEQHINSKQYVLSVNYRSKQEILDAAFLLVRNNRHRVDKDYISQRGEGGLVKYSIFDKRQEEASYIVDTIQREPKETLILARTNGVLNYVEEELRLRKLAYQRVGGSAYFDSVICKIYITTLKAFDRKDWALMQKVLNILFRNLAGHITAEMIFTESEPKTTLTLNQKATLSGLRNAYGALSHGKVGLCMLDLSDMLIDCFDSLGYRNPERIGELAQLLHRFDG